MAAAVALAGAGAARRPGPRRCCADRRRRGWRCPLLSPALRASFALAAPGLAGGRRGAARHRWSRRRSPRTEPGAVAALYYADRLFQLPLGFVAAGGRDGGAVRNWRAARAGATGRGRGSGPSAGAGRSLLAVPAGGGARRAGGADRLGAVRAWRVRLGRTRATAAALAALAVGLPAAAVSPGPGAGLLRPASARGRPLVGGVSRRWWRRWPPASCCSERHAAAWRSPGR